MVCSWLKVLEQEQAEAAEGMGMGGERLQLQKAYSLTLYSVLHESHSHQDFASGLSIAHFGLELAEI